MNYENDIKRMQIEHDLEAGRIITEGKKETADFLKLIEKSKVRRQIDKAPPETPARKCKCGAALEKRQRYCKRCRAKNRLRTKTQYQRKFRLSGCSTVNRN